MLVILHTLDTFYRSQSYHPEHLSTPPPFPLLTPPSTFFDGSLLSSYNTVVQGASLQPAWRIQRQNLHIEGVIPQFLRANVILDALHLHFSDMKNGPVDQLIHSEVFFSRE